MIKCGDALDLLKELPDNSVDCAVVDPPYYRIMLADWTGRKYEWDNQWDNFGHYLEWVSKWILEIKRILKENGSLYIFANDKLACYVRRTAEEVGYGLVNEIVWVKRNVFANKGWRGHHIYTPLTERILFFAMAENERKQGTDKARRYFNQDSNFTDVWIGNMTVSTDEQVHPTQKPLWLLRRIIKTSCPPGGVVLDPFMGSGTTGVVCEVLNRTFIGFEMDKTYFEIAEKRIREQKYICKLYNFDSVLEGI